MLKVYNIDTGEILWLTSCGSFLDLCRALCRAAHLTIPNVRNYERVDLIQFQNDPLRFMCMDVRVTSEHARSLGERILELSSNLAPPWTMPGNPFFDVHRKLAVALIEAGNRGESVGWD